MTKLIVLTDLHMVPEGSTIIGLDPHQRLEAGVQHINRHHADADLVVITGDLTHFGDPGSYVRLKRLTDRLVPPVAMTIGNHDRREVFAEFFPQAARDENDFVQQAIDLPDCRLVILDTLSGPPYDHADRHSGLLCRTRLDWFADKLATAGDRPVLVFMHHPPHRTGFSGMDAIRLTNEEEFYDVALRHGNVRHIFAGHVHRTIGGSHRGIPFSIFKSTAHQQPMPFDSPDTSASVDEPAAYGIVVVTDHGLQVHNEDYQFADRAISTY